MGKNWKRGGEERAQLESRGGKGSRRGAQAGERAQQGGALKRRLAGGKREEGDPRGSASIPRKFDKKNKTGPMHHGVGEKAETHEATQSVQRSGALNDGVEKENGKERERAT